MVAGASSHPGKFGFVTLHNLLRFGYDGEIFAVNREGTEVLGRPTYRDVAEIPDGRADLVFVCTPNKANVELLRACAKKGVRAAFVASAGYGEAGEEGKRPRARAGRRGRRARHADRRAQRTGRHLDAALDVRADRGAVPARRDASRS